MSTGSRVVVATMLAALLLTTMATVLVRSAERRDDRARLEKAATGAATAIERELIRVIDLGAGADAGLSQAGEVNADTFAIVLRVLGVPERFPALVGGALIEVVPRSELDQRIEARQTEGSFALRADGGGTEVSVITYVYPLSTNEPALGIDLATLEESYAAHREALASGEPRLSAATQIVQLAPDAPGAVLHTPLEGLDGPATLGYIIDAQTFLDELGPFVGDVAIVVRDPQSERFPILATAGEPDLAPGPRTVREVVLAGHTWEVEVIAPGGFIVPWPQRGSSYLAVGGGLATILLGLLAWSSAGRERYATELAVQRTEELAQANEQLATAARQKDRFLASVSHELRTPLTVIAGFVELIERAPPERQADLVGPIARNVQRLSALVEDLLTLASLDAGALQARPEPVDLAELLADLPEQLVGLDAGEVAVDLLPGSQVYADRRHLERILVNLLSNAARHGQPPVMVRVRPAGDDDIEVEVRDHGVGLAASAEAELFNRFARGREERRSTGTGLGLAIVRELAAVNGGSVSYEPAAPGARFVVRLPAVPAPVVGAGGEVAVDA